MFVTSGFKGKFSWTRTWNGWRSMLETPISASSAMQLDWTGRSEVERRSHTLTVPRELPVRISVCDVKVAAFSVQLSASARRPTAPTQSRWLSIAQNGTLINLSSSTQWNLWFKYVPQRKTKREKKDTQQTRLMNQFNNLTFMNLNRKVST